MEHLVKHVRCLIAKSAHNGHTEEPGRKTRPAK
jgi:hypothetical protein